LHLALVILSAVVASTAGGSLNLLEQITATPLKIFIEKGDMLGCVAIKVTVSDRFGLHLAKSIKIQLACKGTELVVIKVLQKSAPKCKLEHPAL